MGSTDKDLTDSSKPMPFSTSAARSADTLCDHCENFLRYHVGSRSRQQREAKLTADAEGTLTTLAFALALEACDSQRVSKKQLDSCMNISASQAKIFEKLMRRRGLTIPQPTTSGDSQSIASEPLMATDLADYIMMYSNPLINMHDIVSNRNADGNRLCVLRPMKETLARDNLGRHELSATVAAAWGRARCRCQRAYKHCKDKVSAI